MHGNLPAPATPATIPAVTSVVEKTIADKSVGGDENWFSDKTLELYGKDKPGTVLDCVTDFEFGERNCQRYAAGHVKPTGHIVRRLLRTEHGRQWLFAIMDGCQSEWWIEFQKHERMGRAADSAK